MPQLYEHPSADRPLAETKLNLRVWALYLARDFTRASFARAMEVHYNVIQRWDAGLTTMTLAHFLRACALLRVEPTKLAYGESGRPPELRELSMTDVELRAFYAGMMPAPSFDAIDSLDRWRSTRPGQPLTETFVRLYVSTLDARLRAGDTILNAERAASSAALTGRRIREAHEAGFVAPDPAAFRQRRPRAVIPLGRPARRKKKP